MDDWYNCIEEPLRKLVRILRDNGFNTECSCAHLPKPYIQIEWLDSSDIDRLYELLWDNGYRNWCIETQWFNTYNSNLRTMEISFIIPGKLVNLSDIRQEGK